MSQSFNQFPPKTPGKKAKQYRKKPLIEPVSQEEIYQAGLNIPNQELQALYFFLYLTGARITEALNVRAKDFVDLEGRPVVYVLTLKNKNTDLRPIPLKTTLPNLEKLDAKMAQTVLSFVKTKGPEELVFSYDSRFIAFSRLKSTPNLTVSYVTKQKGEGANKQTASREWSPNPHYLRHCRATHLAGYVGPYVIMDFLGHSTPNTALKYIQRNPKTILKELAK